MRRVLGIVLIYLWVGTPLKSGSYRGKTECPLGTSLLDEDQILLVGATTVGTCSHDRIHSYATSLDRLSLPAVRFLKWIVIYQSSRVILSRWCDRLSYRRPRDLATKAYKRILQQDNRTKLGVASTNSTTVTRKAERLSQLLKALNIIGDGHERSLSHVVAILEDFHKKHGVVDLFAEYGLRDIVASIVVLSALQQRCKTIAADCATARNTECLNSVNDATLEDLAYYAVYASAAYGWKLEFAMRGKMHSADDSEALTRRTPVQHSDILVAKWASTPQRPAYFLARDKQRRKLVLSIRGTFSIDDILTDLCCTSADLHSKRNRRQSGYVSTDLSDDTLLVDRLLSLLGYKSSKMRNRCRVHCGMLQAAESLRNEVADLLSVELKTLQGYSLVLVGHSMAGGVAALLGGLLSNEYPDLEVFAFGPAPCISLPSNQQTLVETSPRIISVIRENDPFRSMSLQHVADLSFMLSKLCEDQSLRDSIMARLFYTKRSRCNDAWLVSTLNGLRPKCNPDKLYPPGRLCLISHVRQRRRGVFTFLPPRRRLSITEIERSFFHDLEIPSVTHFSLHAPTSYEECLRKITKQRQSKRH